MKKKLKITFPFCVVIWIASLFVSVWLFVVLTILGLLLTLALACFLIANKLVKKTNWWKNQYLATEQFVSNAGYRDNIVRNYDIANLGSNPAHFAFFYEDVKGQSWATGSQGQDMDFEILKYFHSYLREGGTVLIPIMPFSAISPYLKERPDYWGMAYYSKFAKILDTAQVRQLPYGQRLLRYLKYPLLYNRHAIRYIIADAKQDNRYLMTKQPMMRIELEQDATIWIKNWLKEFKIHSLNSVFDKRWEPYYDEAVDLNKQMVDFCLERGLKPVFISVPMTTHLAKKFPNQVRQYLITDFVERANIHKIPFLDYTSDERFQNDDLYFNSFFLNLRGRKLFTNRVLRDLGLITE